MKRDNIRLDAISYTGICLDLLWNLGLILLAGITIWLGATGVGKLLYKAEYTASATLVVQEKGNQNTYSSLSMASSMASVFSEVFQSDALRTLITEDVGEEVSGSISCRNIPETNLIVLETKSPDPRQAYLFIHSALKNYEEVSEYVFANASLAIVQEPSVPSAPSNSSSLIGKRYILSLLGMIGMAGVIVLFYLFRYTVKNAEFAADLLDGEIQGVIPFEKKRVGSDGKREKDALLVSLPTVSMRYSEENRKLEARIERHMRRKKLQVLMITSVSENEGKSTVAANIAIAMAEKHKRVLLVDGDFRKPAQYKVFDSEKEGRLSLSDVIQDKDKYEEAIVYNEQSKIWELFQFKKESHPEQYLQSEDLREILEFYREDMDYIIIDCSPTAVATDAEVWMQFTDAVLLVVRQDWSDVRVINDTVDLIWQSGKEFAGFALNAFRYEWFEKKGEKG